jgi:hypothetical protein
MVMNKTLVVCSKANFYGQTKKLQNSPLIISTLKQLKLEESDLNVIILKSSIKRYILSFVKSPSLVLNVLFLILFRKPRNSIVIEKLKYMIQSKQMIEWEKILLDLQPKQIIGIGLPRPLILATKLMNIPSIEVQHGILTSDNLKFYWKFPYNNLDCKPSIILGWDNFFKDIVEDYGIRFVLLNEPWPLTISRNETEKDKNNILILLGYKTFFFINFFTINHELASYLRSLRKVRGKEAFSVKLHPVSYSFFNKVLARIFFRVSGIKIKFSRNLSLTEILPDFSQVLTSKSASVWEIWNSRKEILHFGDLPLDWYDQKIVNSHLFKNMNTN